MQNKINQTCDKTSKRHVYIYLPDKERIVSEKKKVFLLLQSKIKNISFYL